MTFETEAAIQRVVSHGTHRLRGSTIAIDIAMPKMEDGQEGPVGHLAASMGHGGMQQGASPLDGMHGRGGMQQGHSGHQHPGMDMSVLPMGGYHSIPNLMGQRI